jgi:DNA-binding IclR family transcriptional regulator
MARQKKIDAPTIDAATPVKSEGRGVQSIEIGARLLAALVSIGKPAMLKDIAREAGFVPAQAHAYLVSYRRIGLVEQDADTGRYQLGRLALDLGVARMRTTDTMRMASEAIEDLVDRTGLTVAIVVWGTFGPTVVLVRESGTQLNMNTRPGTVYSMSGTASGRLFSAFMREEIVKDAIREEERENGTTGRVGAHQPMTAAEIETIRHAGFATIDAPPVPGVSAIAAPVFDHAGQMVLAITIIGDQRLIEKKAETDFVPALLSVSHHLSANLGFKSDPADHPAPVAS